MVIVKLGRFPTVVVQPSFVALNTIVPTRSEPVTLLGAVYAILPVPLKGIPIEAKLLVQLNTSPPPVFALNGRLIDAPGHTLTLTTAAGIGSGLTVIVKILTGPVQPFNNALTLMVATTGTAVAFTPTKPGISNGATASLPSTKPIAAPPLQLNVSPPPVLTPNAINGWPAPEHTL